MGETSNGEE